MSEKNAKVELSENELKMAAGGGDGIDSQPSHACDDSPFTDDCPVSGRVQDQ